MSELKHGPNADLESEQSETSEEPLEAPARINKIENLIKSQNEMISQLNENFSKMWNSLVDVKDHQDQSDAAIIEVAKKVGSGSGGSGNLLAQILPILAQPRGPSPMEKIAMNMFLRNMTFSSLVTDRLAKQQFGEAYTTMVKEMEAELYGQKKSEGT